MKRRKLSLPVVDPSRTAFGFPRTRCSCKECVAYCQFLPGYLVPEDLGRMIAADLSPLEWAKAHLLASPGALVMNTQTGEVWRIPTLVPARKEDGACIFLGKEGRCRIHRDAPFGCAFFDHTEGRKDLSAEGLRLVQAAQEDRESLYHRLWIALAELGLVAPSPEEGRRLMELARQQWCLWWKRSGKKRRRR